MDSRIRGIGPMAEATRAHDWATTPLGPIESWSETLLATVNILLSAPHPIILFWGEEMTQIYNDTFVSLLTPDRHTGALGRSGRQFWHDSWPLVGHQLEAVLYRGEVTERNGIMIPIYRNGVLEDVWWNYSYSPVYLPDGSIGGVLDICQDITSAVIAERERAEALAALRTREEDLRRSVDALHSERSRLLGVFQQAPIFFALLEGPTHIFTMTNSLYDTVVGGNRDILGKPVAEAVPEAVEQGYIGILDNVFRTGDPYVATGAVISLVRIEGQPVQDRILDFVYQPLREADGTISGILVLGVDVTERNQAERALIQSEKLAAVGRLAASIAHEINNPLEAVTNLLFLARHSADIEEIQRFLDIADAELRRAAAITSQTLRFHRQSTHPVPMRGPDLLEATLSLFHGRIANAHIDVDTRIRNAPPVTCFDGEIRQVLGNLFSNALDAMRSRDRLLLRSREGRDWATGRPGLILTVADTGSGMPPETLARAFEPFFTTKGIGGTGLGLWISADIINRHRGTLRVRSSQRPRATGTTVRVFLPYDSVPEHTTAVVAVPQRS